MTQDPSSRQETRATPPASRSEKPTLPTPAADWALFLDVDGTLVEIAAEPDGVEVGDHLVALLGRLDARFDGAIALVSGRTIETLDRLFAPLRLKAAGNHGLERRGNGGRIVRPLRAPEMDDVRAAMAGFAAANPGVIVEDKSLSVALHYRNCPRAADAAARLARRLTERFVGRLVIQPGKMMVEVRPDQGDKGTAIAQFLGEPPFAGRIPVFIGDDVTDEDGFRLINARGGHSVRVGNGSETSADFQVPDVVGVIRWLEEIANA
jgi:trehalose 6-phosphate phosphatase